METRHGEGHDCERRPLRITGRVLGRASVLALVVRVAGRVGTAMTPPNVTITRPPNPLLGRRIRRGKLPARVDACLGPIDSKPMSCASS